MTKTYYDIEDDVIAYPDAWCYIIVGGRNTGKTYSGLMYNINHKSKHVFVKRTNKDIDLLCSGNSLGSKSAEYDVDLSPYKSINRDTGLNIKAFKIDDGLGGFYKTDEEGSAIGAPEGYLISLSAIHKFKGFDLSECADIIFDEFIPQPWERISRTEGEALMELYKTTARDRTLRGRDELKLFCFANAVNVFNYTCEILEVTDIIAEMAISHKEVTYLEDRGIFIRILQTSDEMMQNEKQTGIYRAMSGTAWGRMAFRNEFAYNDFSNIKRIALKGYRPIVKIIYKCKDFYVYNNNSSYYICSSRAQCRKEYNLDKELDQKAFYYDYAIDLRNKAIEGKMVFEKYSLYDLIINYKKRFQI